MLNVTKLKECLDYNKETGFFTWKCNKGGSARIGSIAGSIDSKGYVQIRFDGKLYLAHRLAFAFENGELPKLDIDHIDRNPKNNAFSNLRTCKHSENHQNVDLRSDNTSGITGVSYIKQNRKWLAYINKDGKRFRLGLFESKDSAIKARLEAKPLIHTFHPIQGIV